MAELSWTAMGKVAADIGQGGEEEIAEAVAVEAAAAKR